MLFLIPLRRYFVRDMHGLLPYPEATAITEVLVTGEKGGSQARLLLEATAIAGVYDFFVTTFHVWKEYLDFQFVPAVRTLAERARVGLSFDAISFILGLGYVMGLRSSMILCAGGVLSNLVLVPLVWMIGSHISTTAVYPARSPIAQMTAAQIFRGYVRFVGVGAIATAGIFGILKSMRIVAGSFGVALRAFRRGGTPMVPAMPAWTHRPRHFGDGDPGRRGRERHRRRACCWAVSRASPAVILVGCADPGLLVLLYLGGGQRHRHHRAQSGLRHDHADHHHFVGGAAAVRPLRHYRHVLRDGDRGHGVHRAFGLRPGHHRFQDRLLAGLHARRAGEGEVPGRGRGVGGGGPDHRDAGARHFNSARPRPATRAWCWRRRRPPS